MFQTKHNTVVFLCILATLWNPIKKCILQKTLIHFRLLQNIQHILPAKCFVKSRSNHSTALTTQKWNSQKKYSFFYIDNLCCVLLACFSLDLQFFWVSNHFVFNAFTFFLFIICRYWLNSTTCTTHFCW